jgi:hypothetical protein
MPAPDISQTANDQGDFPPWVSGLRPEKYEEVRAGRWKETLAYWIIGQRFRLEQNKDALKAEGRLNISPSDYWFIGRARQFFGPDVVVIWQSIFDPTNPPVGGLCPFDTGLLASDEEFLILVPGSNPQSVMNKYNRVLTAWPAVVLDDLLRSYDTLSDYVQGNQPESLVPEILGARLPSLQDGRWTWEARLSKANPTNAAVEPLLLFLWGDRQPQFLDWLEGEECPLDVSDARRVIEWLPGALQDCPEVAWQAANNYISNNLIDRPWKRS